MAREKKAFTVVSIILNTADMFCLINDKNLLFLLPGNVIQGLKTVGFVCHLPVTPSFSLAYLSIIEPTLILAGNVQSCRVVVQGLL